ncbi:hypothetical protein HKK55_14810 [Pseudomonas sp. ADAK18]|uniref:hypothetical protein n=1 Tax=Pseudomonas sp. ADAK18 TaxID=2730848 RepID=UPI001462CC75|nr:hypothetical protein [Pseudomonas sp. ADAK18]QJI29923.1 hypothetical protein HKK55_14810 [Pseudomonas sp. ADAK18]
MTDVGKHAVAAGNEQTLPEYSRTHAVAAALEVIAALAAGGTALNLTHQFEHLSKYADQIQEALKVK